MWVGDALYFVPYLSRLDSENNRGSINFDDICVAQQLGGNGLRDDQNENRGTVIPNGYQGFNWNGLQVVDVQQYSSRVWDYECSDGLTNSLVSLENVALNLKGSTVNITSSNGGLFSFNSAFLTAVCPSPQVLSIFGLRGGSQVYNVTLVLTDSLPIPFTPHWDDIDTLFFSSSIVNSFGVTLSTPVDTFFAIDDIILVADSEANLVMRSLNERLEQQNKRATEENEKLSKKISEMSEENNKLRNKIESFEETLNELKKRIQ